MVKTRNDASGDPVTDTGNYPMTGARVRARRGARCGAQTRAGSPCQAPAVKGGKRCRRHGGESPGAQVGNQWTKKHGIYGTYLTADEIASVDVIRAQTGKLDAEIELLRVRIRRALKAEACAESNEHDGLELQKFVDKQATEFTAGPERIYERVDYNGHIERLTRRLESLERTRAELLEAQAKRDAERDDYESVSQIQVTVINTDGSFTRSDGTIGNVKNGDRP